MKKRIFLSILILLIAASGALALTHYFLAMNRPGQPGPFPERKEGDLRIATLNINWLSFNHDPAYTSARLASIMKEYDIDVVLLQEYRAHWKLNEYEFISIFSSDYSYISIQDECVCISKYPVVAHKRVKYDDLSDSFSDMEILLSDSQRVRIFAAHLITTGVNNFRGADQEAVSSIGSIRTFINNTRIRNNQAVRLSRRASEVQSPLVIAGDFNCIPYATAYRKITRAGLKDCFMVQGHGKGSTYRNLKDLFRIDFIFYNRHLECTDCRIVDEGISDHKMVVSTFINADAQSEKQ